MSTDEKPVETSETPAPAADAAPRAQTLPAMTPALKRRLAMCYDHATKLSQADKKDYGYIGTLLGQCVSNDPANQPYWDAFFQNAQAQHKDKRGGSLFGGFGGAAGTIKAHNDKEEYVSALKAGVDALLQNPWDVGTLRAMAETCEKLGLNETELRLLKSALNVASKDIEVNRHCAKSLARMGLLDQAIACWHRVESANRDDPEATRAISNLTVQKARIASGIKDEANKQSGGGKAGGAGPAPEKAASPEAQKKREIKLTPKQQLERKIVDRPADIENYFALADLLIQESRASEAINILKKALEASGGDIQVRERLEDAELERARVTCVLAEKKAAADSLPESQEQAKKLRSEWNRAELDLIFARAQRYPQKKELRYEMAVRLKRMGNYAEAIKYLDEIVGDEKWIGPASLEMGECYQHLQQYDKAWGAYKIALKSLFEAKGTGPELEEHRKLALYRAGVLATGLRKVDRAVQFLERLVKLDPHYKDAPARLDKARHLGDKG